MTDTTTASSARLLAKASTLLMQGEDVLAVASQNFLGHWMLRPASGVVVTSRRMLFVNRRILSMAFQDLHWEHIEDVHIDTSWKGATISATGSASKSGYTTHAAAAGQTTIAMPHLRSAEAQRVYSVAQQIESEWRERSRQRLIEERRADKHIVIGDGGAKATGAEPATVRLEKLKQLREMNLISAEEYEAKRKDILNKL